ncbi:MAG: GNAT family protein [Gemmatimonadales bacterium]
MMELTCTPETRLRSLRPSDAATLLAAVDADRAMFDRWLRWSGTVRSHEAAREFIVRAADLEQEGRGFHWGLWRGTVLLGGIPCWSIDPVHRVAELGYWLSTDVQGQGLATTATRIVVEHLFTQQHVNRVEFQCRTENVASRRVAERVGGQFEGVRRQSHWVAGAFRDHAVYAILAGDLLPASA